MSKQFYTDYKTAAHWQGTQLILCNEIADLDYSIWDNMRLGSVDTDSDGAETSYPEIYQWFLTNLSENSVHYMEETFDLIFTYSEMLNLWILCVDHYGTSWDYVPCKVYSESWQKFNKNLEYKH